MGARSALGVLAAVLVLAGGGVEGGRIMLGGSRRAFSPPWPGEWLAVYMWPVLPVRTA